LSGEREREKNKNKNKKQTTINDSPTTIRLQAPHHVKEEMVAHPVK